MISDTNFLINSAERITRALLEICLLKNYARPARYCLAWCNAINRKIWWTKQTLLRHFDIPSNVAAALETHHQQYFSTETPLEHVMILNDMPAEEISRVGKLTSSKKGRLTGHKLIDMIQMLPLLEAQISVHPINQSMMQIRIALRSTFTWNLKYERF